MFRISTLFLCMLLAAASIGRYRAEEAADKARIELERLETSQLEELRKIQVLRAEVAYLENPERLAKIARAKTELRPSDNTQVVTPVQFAAALNGGEIEPGFEGSAPPSEIITNAIAMVQLDDGE